MRLFLYNPVRNFLNERTERINTQLADAESKQSEAIALKQEYGKHIQTYKQEGSEIVHASQMKASQEAQKIVQDARAQAEHIIADAHVKIVNEKAQAIAEARTEVALFAVEIAGRVLKREVNASDNKDVAEAFFREMR